MTTSTITTCPTWCATRDRHDEEAAVGEPALHASHPITVHPLIVQLMQVNDQARIVITTRNGHDALEPFPIDQPPGVAQIGLGLANPVGQLAVICRS